MNIKDSKLREEPTLEQPQVEPPSTVIDFDQEMVKLEE